MKDGILIIDGVEYNVQIKEKDFVDTARPRTGYERVDNGKYYWRPMDNGQSCKTVETYHPVDSFRCKTGIYYNDEIISNNNIRADNLMRQLRRWQALNDSPVDWGNYLPKYYLQYRYAYSDITVDSTPTCRRVDDTYFSSREKAEEAIKIFKDELLWCFTKYQQRLDEPKHKSENK